MIALGASESKLCWQVILKVKSTSLLTSSQRENNTGHARDFIIAFCLTERSRPVLVTTYVLLGYATALEIYGH